MVLPPIFSGLPREATAIARDTWVAMDSCCRGQMGVEVSPNRQIRKSWFRQVSHSTHPYGRPKCLVLGSEIPDDETSLFMSPNGIGLTRWELTCGFRLPR